MKWPPASGRFTNGSKGDSLVGLPSVGGTARDAIAAVNRARSCRGAPSGFRWRHTDRGTAPPVDDAARDDGAWTGPVFAGVFPRGDADDRTSGLDGQADAHAADVVDDARRALCQNDRIALGGPWSSYGHLGIFIGSPGAAWQKGRPHGD